MSSTRGNRPPTDRHPRHRPAHPARAWHVRTASAAAGSAAPSRFATTAPERPSLRVSLPLSSPAAIVLPRACPESVERNPHGRNVGIPSRPIACRSAARCSSVSDKTDLVDFARALAAAASS